MEIRGVEGRTVGEVEHEIPQGGRFVHFQYCISLVVMTFYRPSNIYYLRPGESAVDGRLSH